MGARGSCREWDVNTKVQRIFKSEYKIPCRTGSVPYLDCDSGSKTYTRLFTIVCVCVCVCLCVNLILTLLNLPLLAKIRNITYNIKIMLKKINLLSI